MHYPRVLLLRPSRRLLLLIAAIHLVAAIAFVFSSLERGVVALALWVLALSFLLARHRERMKGGRVLRLADSGLLGLNEADSSPLVRPLPGCTDFGWAVWLQWRTTADDARNPTGGALMLLPDSFAEGEWRALRIWLRHKAPRTLSAEQGTSQAPGP